MNYIEADGVRYYKPNITAMKGEWGKRIFEHIRATPPIDYEAAERDGLEILNGILEAKRNGTY